MIQITPSLAIDEREISEEFIRAAGPGGQHVNKVASAVQLRFDIAHSPSLPEEVRQRLLRQVRHRLTDEGVLIITAREARTQVQNRAAALAQFVEIVRRATIAPKPRRKTAPSATAKAQRLQRKRQRSDLKRIRRSVHKDSEE